MKNLLPRLLRLFLPALGALVATAAGADTLKVLTTGAFKQVVVAAAPAFEARTGHKLDVLNDTAGALQRRISGGEAFDVVVLTPAALQALGASGHVDPATIKPLAKVGIGIAVKADAPAPVIGTVEQFKEAILRARSVAYIDPAAGGSSGIYLDGLFQRMGIAGAVRAKAVLVQGGFVAEKLVTGEADLAVHQISEILPVAGAKLVGPLPEEIQNYTTYAGAVGSRTATAEASRAFLAALASADTARIMRDKGMVAAQ